MYIGNLQGEEDYATVSVAHSTPITPGGSLYIPQGDETDTSIEISFDDYGNAQSAQNKPGYALNAYLQSRDTSPIRSRLSTPLDIASERSKRYYVRKAVQSVTAVMEDIAPKSPAQLFQALCSSKAIQNILSSDDESDKVAVDETLMEALAECYHAATCWETRRQILSIMADKVSFRKLRRWIPDLSNYRFTEAKRHCLVHGRGAPIPSVSTPGMRVSTAQVDHFITFITSAHAIQDLPFGERTVTLTSRETIKVPNVIRTMIPERIVKQYIAYCDETGFKPLSRSTLVRNLNVCPASVRKSLQGLDYISSSGAQAFDDLCEVSELLGDAGQGVGWAKQQQSRLRESKRYLKSDYKVRSSR